MPKTKKTVKAENTANEKALYRHISFFQSNANGDLTTKHMIKRHHQMGDNKWTVPYKVDAIEHMLDDRQKPHNVDSLLTLYNPASSGIWDKDGNFDNQVFESLASQHIEKNGKQIITKKTFENFIQQRHEGDEAPSTATKIRILGCLPYEITWQAVTQGSIDEIFEYFSDCTYNKEPAITVEALRHFYEHPDESMQALIDKKSAENVTEDDNASAPLRCPYSSMS